MAKIKLNPLVQGAQGKLGHVVFRRTPSGGMSLIKLADMSKVEWSESQQAHRQQFKEAIAYAKATMAHPAVRAHYEQIARKFNKRPFHLAVSDYFKGRNLLEE